MDTVYFVYQDARDEVGDCIRSSPRGRTLSKAYLTPTMTDLRHPEITENFLLHETKWRWGALNMPDGGFKSRSEAGNTKEKLYWEKIDSVVLVREPSHVVSDVQECGIIG